MHKNLLYVLQKNIDLELEIVFEQIIIFITCRSEIQLSKNTTRRILSHIIALYGLNTTDMKAVGLFKMLGVG